MTSLASYAAFRAGMHYAADTESIGRDGEPLRAAYLTLLPLDKTRHERMLDLAVRALDDLASSVQMEVERRIAVFLGLPDPASPGFEADAFLEAFTPVLRARMAGVHDRPRSFCQGRSAFFFALEAGLAALESMACDTAVIGAVDSMCPPEVLVRLDAEHRLLGPSLDGIIPGEGAAFVVLERSETLGAKLHREMGMVLCASTGQEDRHFQQTAPNAGRALSSVLRVLREHPAGRGKRADLFYTCETGESFWSNELSMAYLRNVPLMPEPFTRTMAAEAFGDLGAGAGGVLFSLGVYALTRWQRPTGSTPPILLLCGSSDDGHVGACLVQGLAWNHEQSF
jgi:3-oxoacyl-[acyl-carrier-protein] synthase-1